MLEERSQASRVDVERLFDTQTTAYQEAPPASGHHPVIPFAHGGGGIPLPHTVTCELLAGHGYYVFMAPSRGRDDLPTRIDPKSPR
jgi:predicted dienelactone hydrolase